MSSKSIPAVLTMAVVLAAVAVVGGRAVIAQDSGQAKYTVRVPNGLAFSEASTLAETSTRRFARHREAHHA